LGALFGALALSVFHPSETSIARPPPLLPGFLADSFAHATSQGNLFQNFSITAGSFSHFDLRAVLMIVFSFYVKMLSLLSPLLTSCRSIK